MAHDPAAQALAALQAGEVGRVLALRQEAEWLRAQLPGAGVRDATGLPRHTLALGMWKNTVILKRALAAAPPTP